MSNDPIIAVFIGKAGSGKGTQAKRLVKYLGADHTLYAYTGAVFRALIEDTKTYTATLLKEQVLDRGGLAPRFLAIWAWGDKLIHKLGKDQHIVLDGSPRTLLEAQALDEMFSFYRREKNTFIFHINISDEEAMKRLQIRARHDDTNEAIIRRLDWFREEVLPVISYFKNEGIHHVVDIDGVGSEEEVFERIKTALS